MSEHLVQYRERLLHHLTCALTRRHAAKAGQHSNVMHGTPCESYGQAVHVPNTQDNEVGRAS